MSAGVYTLALEKGARKVFQVTYKDALDQPINLTGYSGRGKIRLRARDTDAVASFTVTVSDPVGGVVSIELASDALDALPPRGGTYSDTTEAAYDIELYTADDADVIRLLNGVCTISPEVTR